MHLIALLVALVGIYSPVFGQLSDPATLGATIKADKKYQLLPACVNQCLWDIGDNDTPKIGGDLAIHLSCSSPWINGCYCRGASASYAHSFISSCATYLCSIPKQSDIEAATSVYQGYCKQALGTAYIPEGVDQPLPTSTDTPGTVPSRPSPTLAKVASLQFNSSSGISSPSSGPGSDEKIAGLSKGTFIGVVVSASCSVLGMVFVIWFKIYKHKQQKRIQAEHQMGVQSLYHRAKA
ncbi:unnamed protein product [Periconia digitata]|uniref:Extracellular membrane protein CFEM domain-containing protein n=1 Tax=Periconia digitata TaxID=1303443 RepID=A0A9W4UFH0_9PLEO|nr:unnamed protein product [Periconia digitata]